MTGIRLERAHGSYLLPRFERARVADVMRHGVISCAPDTSLQTVARIMSGSHVHSVVVMADDEDRSWGIVSDMDVLGAAAPGAEELLARDVAATDVVTVNPSETLERAAQLLREHECAHLIVVAPGSGAPVGVVSTLDIAGAIAWGEG